MSKLLNHHRLHCLGRRSAWAVGALALAGLLGSALRAPAAPVEPPKYADLAASRAEFDRVVAPFLATHCGSCHNSQKHKGDLDLATLDPDMKGSTSAARWAVVVDKLRSGEMPPKDQPRPAEPQVDAVLSWIAGEMKRSGKHLARRAAYANGNAVPHEALFGPAAGKDPLDVAPRVRRLSPEIYGALTAEIGKGATGVGQPFSPEGKTTFKDMGAPKVDEPVTSQLIGNALAIVEKQTAHRIEDGKVKAVGFTAKEYLALFDPQSPPTDAQIGAAVDRQFDVVLRRKPTNDERQRFVAFMHKNMAEAGQVAGAKYALAAVFLLPEAVFRLEVGSGQRADDRGRVRLSGREVAFAIGYALTDRGPDAALLAAADKGELDTDAGVARHVRRMLDDPKLQKPRVLRFFREYFGYEAATDVFKDQRAIAFHDARALIEDTDRLVEWVLERDKDVLRELLTTNKSFVAYKSADKLKKERADALAKFEREKAANPEKFKTKKPQLPGRAVFEAYSLPDFPDQQPAELPATQRAGILTQPAWLVAWSKSDDNDAIHRGKWIRERLLGGVVPDIPITVDAQLPDAPHHTLRERMKVTQQEYCWKCHTLMNDLGLPFEAFDHLGRYRTMAAVLDADATAKNVDKKGKPLGPVTRDVPIAADGLIRHVGDPSLDGVAVKDAVELIHKLAGSERVEQVFVRHAFRYWAGRNETPGDAASLQAAHRDYRASGGSMKALIVALLTSESFLYRVPATAQN
jgi:mono/diheme cytochrome c family protein